MFSKLLIGVFAVAVMSVGGFAYYHHVNGDCCGTCSGDQGGCPTTQTPPVEPASELPSCCQQLSRTNHSTEGSCCAGLDDVKPVSEVLSIQPREVK